MRGQQEKVNTPVTERQKRILRLILETGSVTGVSKLLGVNKSYISRSVRGLERKGYLKINTFPDGFREYLATSKCSQLIAEKVNENHQKVTKPFSKIRVHRLEIKCPIPYAIRPGWEAHLNRVMSVDDYRPVKLNNTEQRILHVDGIRVKTTTKSVLFYPDDIYADSVTDANERIGRMVERVLPKIERRFGVKLREIEVSAQEWAFQDDLLARKYIDNGMRAAVLVNGRRRIIIDYSKRVPELEAVHRRHAPEDAEKYENLIRDVITDRFDHRAVSQDIKTMKGEREDFRTVMEQVQEQNGLVSQNLLEFSKYLNQHIKLMAMAEQKYDLTERENRKMRKALETRAKQSSIFHFTL